MEDRTGQTNKKKNAIVRTAAIVPAAAVLLTALPVAGIILFANKKNVKDPARPGEPNVPFPDPKPVVFSGGEYSFDISVSYVMRAAVEGHFMAESAFIKNCRTGAFSVSERKSVDIAEHGGWRY